MKTYSFRWLLVLTSLAACQPSLTIPPTPAAGLPDYSRHPKKALYQRELDQFRKNHGAPGGILLVKTEAHGLWVGASGQANLEHGTAMRGTERILVGSITKTLTATVLLKLHEQGRLRLSDKLADWLPQTKDRIPGYDRITLRHLLTHTSGVRNVGEDNIPFQLALVNRPADTDMSRPETILQRFIYGKPLDFEPGTRYYYSNTGYLLLGMVAEKAGGKPLKALFQEFILGPAGMIDSYLEKRNDERVVRTYFDLYGDGKLIDVGDWERAYDDGSAEGGLITTVTDLLKFSEALFGGRLLRESSLNEMKQTARLPTCPNGDCEYGLGLSTWAFTVGNSFGHNGGVIGIDANWFYFPDKKATVITFLNKGIPTDKRIIDRLLQ